jgi:tight adherence protein C
VVLWTFLAVLLLGVGIYDLAVAPRRRLRLMLERAGGAEPAQAGGERLFTWLKDEVIPRMPLLPGATPREELRQLLLWAGRPGGMGAEEFYFLQVALAAVLAFLLAGAAGWVGALAGAAVGLLGPKQWLRARVAQTTLQLRRELPRFVHLLATCLEAGLGLNEAVRRVAAESPGLLSGEMLRTVHEMAAGKPAARAWRDLMERHESPELKETVTAIMQSHEYGVGIAEQLRFSLRAIRQRKQQQAQQKAQEASVRMRLPMVLFILMPTIVIVIGPAVIQLMRDFMGG